MAQYEVLRPIEVSGKLYVPASSDVPSTVRSAGNGAEVTVDRGGVIELTPALASQFTLGQIKPVNDQQSAPSKRKAPPKADS